MKSSGNRFVVGICILLGSAAVFGGVSGVNILWETYEVYGGTFFNGVLDEYHLVSGTPLEGRSIGSISHAERDYVFADASGDDFSNVGGACAITKIGFNPLVTELMLKLDGHIWFTLFETEVTCKLFDYNNGQTLYDFKFSPLTPGWSGSDRNRYFSDEQVFSGLDRSHLYELTMIAKASTGDGGTASLNMDISPVNAVPLPSSFLLGLLGAGLVRRFKS